MANATGKQINHTLGLRLLISGTILLAMLAVVLAAHRAFLPKGGKEKAKKMLRLSVAPPRQSGLRPASVRRAAPAPGFAEKANAADAGKKAATRDRQQAQKMRDLLDNERNEESLVVTRGLIHSKDEQVRSEVVEVLGWIGVRALPELTKLLNDPSEAIAENALSQWKMALGDVDDPATKACLLTQAMQVLNETSDLEMLALEYSQFPEDVAVRQLIEVIQSKNSVASEVAREQYEFITGEAFTTRENSEAWIKENVEAAD